MPGICTSIPNSRRSGHLLRRVETLRRLAEDRPVLSILQPDRRRRLPRLSRPGERAVGRPLAAGDDETLLGAALCRRDLPLRGRSRHEHLPGHRPHLAIAIELRPRGRRPARHLRSVRRMGVDGGRGRALDADLRPIAAELLGDHHRQRRPDALPHLRVREEHGHGLVFADAKKRVRRWKRRGRARRLGEEPAPRGDDEPDDEPRRSLEEPPARKSAARAHALPPAGAWPAAMWTASRIRW